jgi:hypothetical protein
LAVYRRSKGRYSRGPLGTLVAVGVGVPVGVGELVAVDVGVAVGLGVFVGVLVGVGVGPSSFRMVRVHRTGVRPAPERH